MIIDINEIKVGDFIYYSNPQDSSTILFQVSKIGITKDSLHDAYRKSIISNLILPRKWKGRKEDFGRYILSHPIYYEIISEDEAVAMLL